MAIRIADRVKETTTTTGTGTIDLGGAVTGFQTFVAGIGTGNSCYYTIAGGSQWETGIGTVTDASPDTLSRAIILASSNSGAAVDFSAGTKDVFCTLPATGIGTRRSPAVWAGTNITSGRAVNTVYQNTTGGWMVVMANCVSNAIGTIFAYTDSSNPPTTQVSKMAGLSSWNETLIFFVANNDYYEITGPVGSVQAWSEYRIVKGTITKSSELHASRSLDTAYQNTSGSLIFVSLQAGTDGGIKVFSDSSNPPTTEILDHQMVSASGTYAGTMIFPVLAGEYYKISAYTGSPTIDLLYEYTWAGVGATRSPVLATSSGGPRETLLTGVPSTLDRIYLNTSGGSIFMIMSGRCSSTSQTVYVMHETTGFSGFAIPLNPKVNAAPVLYACAQTGGASTVPRAVYAFVAPFESYSPWSGVSFTFDGWYEWKIVAPPGA